MLNKTEILAPAGDVQSVRAAVNAGTDAVYLGGSMFSARAFAGNFDREELLNTIDYCHIHDVKIYMAVNTLLKNDELERLPEYVEPYYREGVDGIIVQDMGVVSTLAEHFPGLPLHGSTQMSVSSSCGAAFLKSLGMTRFVPSRELSLEEIKQIKKEVDIEIETFVHGAMCYCYSGRCLMSSYAGGRSGNRGRCAQPCRKIYNVCGADRDMRGTSGYALSLKDMCLLESLDKLIDAGIDSFKIEGRMKKPEYVAAAVRAYREVRDACLAGDDITDLATRHEKLLRDVYNRGGFCSGYYFAKNGRDMLSGKRPNHTGIKVGQVKRVAPPDVDIKLVESVNPGDVLEIRGKREVVELTCNVQAEAGESARLKAKSFKAFAAGSEVYRTKNSSLLAALREQPPAKVQIVAEISAQVGKPLCVLLRQADTENPVCVKALGAECVKASKRPVTAEQLAEKIAKLGDTEYAVKDIRTCVDDDVFVQLGAVNELRREAVRRLDEEIAGRFFRNAVVEKTVDDAGVTLVSERRRLSGVSVSVCTVQQVNIVKNYKWVDNIIVDYNIRECCGGLMDAGFTVILALPEIFRQRHICQYEDMRRNISDCDGVLVRNMDELGIISNMDYAGIVVMAASMYAYNDRAAGFYRRVCGGADLISSEELTLAELAGLSGDVTLKIYGHQKVMVSSGCLSLNYGGDGCGKNGKMLLRDEKGNDFFVRSCCEYCYNVIYNGVPTSLIDRYEEISERYENVCVELTVEDEGAVRDVLGSVEAALAHGLDSRTCAVNNFTRGHYYKGID